ncbi:hypothetical protein D3C71_1246570 [compost metagenome]
MGIGGGRGGVGHPGAGDHAGAAAVGLGQLQQGGDRLAGALAAVALIGGVAVHADDAVVALDPRHVGRHGGGRVGDLGVVGEGLDEGRLRQGVDGEAALFPDAVDAGRGQGVEAHAVAEEEDDVFGAGLRGAAVIVGVAAGDQGGAYHHCKSCHVSHWGSLLVKPERSLEGADDTFSESG